MQEKTLSIIVTLQDLASAQMAGLAAQVDELNAKMAESSSAASEAGQAMAQAGAAMGQVGRTMTNYVTLPIVAVGTAAVVMAAQFETATTKLVTQAGMQSSALGSVRTALEQMATEVPFGPTALADAMYHAVSAGYAEAAALQITKAAAMEATISGSDLVDTTNSLISVMKTGVDGTASASAAMATLNAIVGAGNMTFQDLNSAIGTGFLATAAQTKVSLNQVGAMLAYMTDRGVPAAKAASSLQRAMILMTAPSVQGIKALEGIGISATDATAATSAMTQALTAAHVTTTGLAQMMQTQGMIPALDMLQQKMVASGVSATAANAVIAKAFGGSKSSASVMMLTQNLAGLKQKQDQITNGSKNFQADFNAAANTLQVQFKQSIASVESALIKLGTKAMPGVEAALKSITKMVLDVINGLSKLTPQQDDVLVKFLAVIAVIGPLLTVLGKLVVTIKEVSSIFTGLSKGIKFLTKDGGLIEQFGDICEIAFTVIADIGDALATVIFPAIGDAVVALAAVIGAPVALVVALIAGIVIAGLLIVTHWKQVSAFMGKIFHDIATAFSILVQFFSGGDITLPAKDFTKNWIAVIKFMDGLQSTIKGIFQAIANAIVPPITAMAKVVGDVFMGIYRVIGFALALILAIVIVIFKAIWGVTAPILEMYLALIKLVWGTIYTVIKDSLGLMWTVVSTVFGYIYNVISSTMSGCWTIISAMFKVIYSVMSSVLGAIWNVVSSVWGKIASFTAQIFNSLVGIVAGPVNQVVGVISSIYNRIMSVMSGAAGWLVNAGSQIISGLWNGIKGMGSWLYNNILNFIKSQVPGPVLKILGIHSPSTVFAEIGVNTMKGMSNGVLSQGSAVAQTMATTFGGIVNSSQSALNKLSGNISSMGAAAATSTGNHSGYSGYNNGSGGGSNSTSVTHTNTSAPSITINLQGGISSAGELTYAAKQALIQAQNKSLFT